MLYDQFISVFVAHLFPLYSSGWTQTEETGWRLVLSFASYPDDNIANLTETYSLLSKRGKR